MDYKIVVLPQAEVDIAQAFTYISKHSPEAAARWYQKVKSAIASLHQMPARCPKATETAKLGVELRQLLHGKHPAVYRIVFRIVNEREVHVLAVRHGARKPLTEEEARIFLELLEA
jgi:plasmid stabilization system protein ParE